LVGALGGPVEIGLSGNPIDYLPHALALAAICLGVLLVTKKGSST
jgi:hypothetical protein